MNSSLPFSIPTYSPRNNLTPGLGSLPSGKIRIVESCALKFCETKHSNTNPPLLSRRGGWDDGILGGEQVPPLLPDFAMSSSLGFRNQWTNPLVAFGASEYSLPVLQSGTGLIVSRPICYNVKALKSAQNSDTVVAADNSYGRKEVISVNPRLYDYLLANVREPKMLRELREETATMHGSQMQVSPDQAQLLAMLVQIMGAEKCIEVGVYTGYSSLAVALVLPEGGQLVACERDAKSLEVAQRYFHHAGVSKKVIIKHGLAADTLKSMIQNGEGSSYDFAFVDAEKKMYQDYFELLLQLVRVGGVIVMDNVLWHGRVADPLVNDLKTLSIRNFNRNLMEDDRVSISMVPIGDGMTICRKR